MTNLRVLHSDEKAVLASLLQGKPEIRHFLNTLDELLVTDMSDGGMGSLLLEPKGQQATNRSLGKQLVMGEFTDSDGVPVSVCLNVDTQGRLYELDVWKVNFSPLLSWPDPAKITILE